MTGSENWGGSNPPRGGKALKCVTTAMAMIRPNISSARRDYRYSQDFITDAESRKENSVSLEGSGLEAIWE